MEATTTRDQLLELVKGMGREKLAAMVEDLRALGVDIGDPSRPPIVRRTKIKTTVKQMKLITKHSTCLNCGRTRVYTLELAKGESTCLPGNSGSYVVTVVNDFTPITAQCKTLQCEHCEAEIKKWDRATLEERYMQLLCRLVIGLGGNKRWERMVD